MTPVKGIGKVGENIPWYPLPGNSQRKGTVWPQFHHATHAPAPPAPLGMRLLAWTGQSWPTLSSVGTARRPFPTRKKKACPARLWTVTSHILTCLLLTAPNTIPSIPGHREETSRSGPSAKHQGPREKASAKTVT